MTFSTSVQTSSANDNFVSGERYDHPNGVLYLGDCVRRMWAMRNGSVDFILTDPPYGVNYRDRTGRSIKGDIDLDWLQPAFKEMYRVLAPNSFAVSFYGYNRIDEFAAAWKAAGFRMVGHFTFAKHYASNRGRGYTSRRHENAYLLVKGRPASPANPPSDVLPWGHYTGNILHPTQKPRYALQQLVSAYCAAGGTVLDPFSGSGSTAHAAILEGRRFVGMELEPEFFQTSAQRLSKVVAPPVKRPKPVLRSQRPKLRLQVA